MPDFGSSDLQTFREDVRAWLKENLPPSLAHNDEAFADNESSRTAVREDMDLWRRRLAEKGWGAPTWPRHLGGGGLSAAEARALQEEMAAAGARNPIGGMGIIMFGPTLLEYGNDEQLNRHIPPITRGELRWCQGFSEPGAGSDLASLQTRAEDKGDHWLVNGQKIWTSGAHLADWCFCLVRTDPKAKKHEGISFLLIDMKSPGVEPRPILLINGTTPFCETFFTDVKVPKENLVGPLNGGWTIAKRLLQHERQGISGANGGGAPGVIPGGDVHDLARQYLETGDDGRLADGDLRQRIIAHEMTARAFAMTGRRAALETRGNRGPSALSSILKNVGSQVRQERAELAVEIMGSRGVGWEGEAFSADELATTRAWLRGKSGTIAGGSQEVQYNIIAKRILGLPDPTKSV